MALPLRLLGAALQLAALHALLLSGAAAAGAAGDTYAVIVSSSRYWHNYRHESNALSVYAEVKR